MISTLETPNRVTIPSATAAVAPVSRLLIPPAAREPRTDQPLIAVIIPVFKQPQFLADAIISALRQTLRERIKIVIVNDGCPYPSTDRIGRFFQSTFPDEVVYLN